MRYIHALEEKKFREEKEKENKLLRMFGVSEETIKDGTMSRFRTT